MAPRSKSGKLLRTDPKEQALNARQKQDFWDQKILGWEKSRYASRPPWLQLFERIAFANASVRYRRLRAAEMLQAVVDGQAVLDLGCGSGLLFRDLACTKAASFHGLEWAPSAIANGQDLARRYGYAERTSWLQGDLETSSWPDCQIVAALGVLDWISPARLPDLFAKLSGKRFLVSFSEDRPTLGRGAHQIYTWLSYGYRSSYRPRYYRATDLLAMAAAAGLRGLRIWREPELGFGALLHNLGAEAETPTRQQLVDRYFLRRWASPARPNPILSRFRASETEAVLKALSPLRQASVLDLGCGDGWYLRHILSEDPRSYLGLDRHPHPGPIPQLAHHLIRIRAADVSELPRGEQFDRILCAGLLEFLEQPEALLQRLPELLAPAGRLVLLFPAVGWLGHLYRLLHRRQGYSIALLSPTHIRVLLESHGLQVTELRQVLGLSTVLTARRP